MSAFTGTGTLLRLFLRRDRVRVPIWIVAVVGLTLASAASVIDIYGTARELREFATLTAGNPAIIALNGRAVGLDTLGGRVAFEVLVFVSVTTALMNLLLVGRHTRAEEEAGRTELLRAGVVGSHAQPAAAVLLVTAVDVVIGAAIALGLVALDLPPGGSVLVGAAIAMVGIVFAGIAVVTAQVSEHARGGSGLAGVALGAAFALRAAGDVGNGIWSWLSPIGWAQAVEPFVGDRWWPVAIGLVVAGGLVAGAFWLVDQRDVGGGFIATRPGPPHASRLLGNPIGLAVRLHRGTLAGWAAGVAFLGATFGTVGLEVDQLLESTPEVVEYFTAAGVGTLTEAYFATVAGMLGLLTAGGVVQGLLRMRTEESNGRAELLLGRPVSRLGWATSHLLVVGAGGGVVLALAGAATGFVHGVRVGELSWVTTLAAAGVAQLPAVWVVAAVTLLLYGLGPRLVMLAWGVLAGTFVVMFFGDALRLPDLARDLSPFVHVPAVPAADLSVAPEAALLAVAALLGALGLVALRRRDLLTT